MVFSSSFKNEAQIIVGSAFSDDITEPFVVDPDGTMAVPAGPGIGVVPRPDRLEACTIRTETLKR